MTKRKEWPKQLRNAKLSELASNEGYDDPIRLCADAICDSFCPGICMNQDCDYTTEVEPDCDSGWCEECDTATVASAMILMEVI